MRALAIGLFLISMATSAAELPAWLEKKIAALHDVLPHGTVRKWRYQGRIVYSLPPRCCDIPGELYDSEGNLICHLEGGFAGVADETCRDFKAEAELLETVWRKTKGR